MRRLWEVMRARGLWPQRTRGHGQRDHGQRTRAHRATREWSVVAFACLAVVISGFVVNHYAAARTSMPPASSSSASASLASSARQSLAPGLRCQVNEADVGGTLHSGHRSQTLLQENEQPGTTNWQIDPNHQATTQIQAYASALSVNPGDTLNFYVSVQSEGTPYTATIYRLGWYCGTGARAMSATSAVGHWQGHYDEKSEKLVDCQRCHVDPATHLVEANWQVSYALHVPNDWLTGIYAALFTDARGWQTRVTFDVRGDPHSTYLVVTPDATVAAYNQWGGYSLYEGPDNSYNDRAYNVSFDRPLAGWGAGQKLAYWVDTLRWMERLGYDVSYVSDVDLDQHPDLLRGHRAIISIGHDEYWSKAMRDGVEQARDAGIGLAFLGADTAEWQIRFAADSAGTPDRTVICYKDANLDPMNGVNNSVVTTEWRSPPVLRPENAMTGIMFSNYASSTGFPWHVSASNTGSVPLFQNTGLQVGQTLGCDYVGYEWDRVFNNGSSPSGLVTLATSQTTPSDTGTEGNVASQQGTTDTSNTTYYIAPSGAMVFASGSIYWGFALDPVRLAASDNCKGKSVANSSIQKLMANVMDAIAVKHAV